MHTVKIKLSEVVGNHCLESDDGDKVRNIISKAIDGKYQITVSFEGVETLGTTFLHHAFGALYGQYAQGHIMNHLTVEKISTDDLCAVNRVIQNAIIYFRNKGKGSAPEKVL